MGAVRRPRLHAHRGRDRRRAGARAAADPRRLADGDAGRDRLRHARAHLGSRLRRSVGPRGRDGAGLARRRGRRALRSRRPDHRTPRGSGKPLRAVAGEAALSAAYAIASAADRIYVTRTAEIGSVGILAAHVDESGADAMAGRKWTLVHAGDAEDRRQSARAALRPSAGRDPGRCRRAARRVLRARRPQPAPDAGGRPRHGGRDLARQGRHRCRLRRPAGHARPGARRPRRHTRPAAGAIRPAPHHPTDAGNQHDRADDQRHHRAARRDRSARRHRDRNAGDARDRDAGRRPSPRPAARPRPLRRPRSLLPAAPAATPTPIGSAPSTPRSPRSRRRRPGSVSRSMPPTPCSGASPRRRCAARCSMRWRPVPRRAPSSPPPRSPAPVSCRRRQPDREARPRAGRGHPGLRS